MQGNELILNGVSVDLSDATKIAFSKAANNIAEIQKRQSDFSNIFKLPITTKNRTFFESIENLNSASSLPYGTITAKYIESGRVVVEEGTATIVNSDQDFYYLKLNSGNKEFFGLFPDLKIKDLLIPGSVHDRDFLTVVNSRTNDSGFIYPLINWFESNSTAFNDPEADTEFMFPCLFLKDIFDAVVVLTGYKSKGTFIDSAEFPNVLFSPKDFRRPEEAIEKYNSQTQNAADIVFTPTFFSPSIEIPLTGDINTNFFDLGIFQPDAEVFGYFKASGTFTFTGTGTTSTLLFQVFDDSTNTVLYSETKVYSYLATPKTYSFNVISNNLTIDSSQQVRLRVGFVSAIGSPTITWAAENTFEFKLLSALPYGSEVITSELFDLKVIDVYKDIMNLRGIVPQTDAFRKEIYFDYFDIIQESLPEAPDLSSKIDNNQSNLSYKFGNYGQRNYFRFAAEDTVPEFLNDVFFEISDSTLPDSVNVVQLTASTTEEELKFQGELIPRIKSITSSGSFNATNFRFFVLDRRSVDYDFEYFDTSNTLTTSEDLPFVRPMLFDLEEYYFTIQSILDKCKVLKLRVKISEEELELLQRREDNYQDSFGFLQSVYLNIQSEKIQANGFFYINKVENYQNGFGTVEFIRL